MAGVEYTFNNPSYIGNNITFNGICTSHTSTQSSLPEPPWSTKLTLYFEASKSILGFDEDAFVVALDKGAGHYQLGLSSIVDPAKDTCVWFQESNERYIKWTQSTNSDILWAVADEGCGKSVLSKYIFNALTKSQPTAKICYFHFRNSQLGQEEMLCSLLHQVFRDKSLLKHAAPICKDRQLDNVVKDAPALWSLLRAIASTNSTYNVVCVIDGLDECTRETRRLLIAALKDLFTVSSGSGCSKHKLKFLVTSRPNPEINKHWTNDFIIRLDEHEGFVSDINKMISERVDDMQLLPHVKSHLMSNAGSTFLWAALVLDTLEDQPSLAPTDVQSTLETTPDKIDDMYRKAFYASPNPERTRRLLSVVIAASRPLTLEELDIATCITDTDTSLHGLGRDPRISTALKSLCGVLLRVMMGRVFIFHETVREFLLGCNLHSNGPGPHISLIDSIEVDRILGERCMLYLRLEDWKRVSQHEVMTGPHRWLKSRFEGNGLSTFDHQVDKHLRGLFTSAELDFYGYAAKNWYIHIDRILLASVQNPSPVKALSYFSYLSDSNKKHIEMLTASDPGPNTLWMLKAHTNVFHPHDPVKTGSICLVNSLIENGAIADEEASDMPLGLFIYRVIDMKQESLLRLLLSSFKDHIAQTDRDHLLTKCCRSRWPEGINIMFDEGAIAKQTDLQSAIHSDCTQIVACLLLKKVQVTKVGFSAISYDYHWNILDIVLDHPEAFDTEALSESLESLSKALIADGQWKRLHRLYLVAGNMHLPENNTLRSKNKHLHDAIHHVGAFSELWDIHLELGPQERNCALVRCVDILHADRILEKIDLEGVPYSHDALSLALLQALFSAPGNLIRGVTYTESESPCTNATAITVVTKLLDRGATLTLDTPRAFFHAILEAPWEDDDLISIAERFDFLAALHSTDIPDCLVTACSKGHTRIAKRLLQRENYIRYINHWNYCGMTPLTAAIVSGNLSLCEWLLYEGADPNQANLNWNYSGHLSSDSDQARKKKVAQPSRMRITASPVRHLLIKQLYIRRSDFDYSSDHYGWYTSSSQECFLSEDGTMKLCPNDCFCQDVDLTLPIHFGRSSPLYTTPVVTAVARGQWKMLELLLAHRGDVSCVWAEPTAILEHLRHDSSENTYGDDLDEWALSLRKISSGTPMLSHRGHGSGAYSETKTIDSPLYMCISSMQSCGTFGRYLNHTGNGAGKSILHFAVENGCIKSIQLLLGMDGINPNIRSVVRLVPLKVNFREASKEREDAKHSETLQVEMPSEARHLAEALQNISGVVIDTELKPRTGLVTWSLFQRDEVPMETLEMFEPTARYYLDRSGMTPLHLAVLQRPSPDIVKIVKLLVEAGADITIRDDMQRTPYELMRQVHNPSDGILKLHKTAFRWDYICLEFLLRDHTEKGVQLAGLTASGSDDASRGGSFMGSDHETRLQNEPYTADQSTDLQKQSGERCAASDPYLFDGFDSNDDAGSFDSGSSSPVMSSYNASPGNSDDEDIGADAQLSATARDEQPETRSQVVLGYDKQYSDDEQPTEAGRRDSTREKGSSETDRPGCSESRNTYVSEDCDSDSSGGQFDDADEDDI